MDRSQEIRPLTEDELNFVSGGTITGFGVATDQRIALSQQMTKAYAAANPRDYYMFG
jgi:hypothetical protein